MYLCIIGLYLFYLLNASLCAGIVLCLNRGVQCSKLCHSSLKVKRKLLRLLYPEGALCLKTLGLSGFFSGSSRIDFHTLKDLYIGTSHSVEFREVNAMIRPCKCPQNSPKELFHETSPAPQPLRCTGLQNSYLPS